jgi:glycosyltransferase involved in cell wall biosynthesis
VNRRLNILLSAYYCSPYKGSESAVGWQMASGLAKRHDVTLICGDLSESAPTSRDLERFRLEQGMPPGLEIVHVQGDPIARRLHDLHRLPGLWFLYYEAYRRWQRSALTLARRLHAERRFDVVHHVNIVTFREPGYLWQLGPPFFWGPVSGAPLIPGPFLADFGRMEKLRWAPRNLLNRWQINRSKGRPCEASQAAAKVWVVSEEDRMLIRRWGVEPDLMLECGSTGEAGIQVPRSLAQGERLRLCWSGLFQGIKALPILLRALAGICGPRVNLEVLGDGPERERWKALAEELGLANRVTWHGMVSREEALSVMATCHVLVHTSVKEATATVLLEALERGLPVICHDACGMGVAIDSRCGLRVPFRDPACSVEGFRAALLRVLEEPELLPRLSRGAFVRAEELSWQRKLDTISEAYLSESTQ